jgi:hypothetical protein
MFVLLALNVNASLLPNHQLMPALLPQGLRQGFVFERNSPSISFLAALEMKGKGAISIIAIGQIH